MNKLKEMLERKRKTAAAESGDRKVINRAELEDYRHQQRRQEEEQELAEKERHKRAKTGADSERLRRLNSGEGSGSEEMLGRDEVVRRLRLLGQPTTLFGEADATRLARLRRAQEEFQLTDEHAGGQQANSLLALQRDERLSSRSRGVQQAAAAAAASMSGAAAAPPAEGDRPRSAPANGEAAAAAASGDVDANGHSEAGAVLATETSQELSDDFKQAAEALRLRRKQEQAPLEDQIHMYLKRWCEEWEADLENRPADVKVSGPAHQANIQYKQTMGFLKPLFKQLKKRQVVPEMRAGLWIMVEAMLERNYLYAYDIYMRLAIGNNPWPIGVTSVGIHERSAREKISHVMNGAAHIMNDEATRKYLQAMKRVLTFVQRVHPTDPSRSVDFDAFRDAGRGAAGMGSDKLALLEAEAKGENWKALGLKEAPHFVESDGSIKVPQRWNNILASAERALASPNRTPPRTPPPTPPKSPLPLSLPAPK